MAANDANRPSRVAAPISIPLISTIPFICRTATIQDAAASPSVAASAAAVAAVLVFVMAAPPDACLVAAERRTVEPLVHAPQAVQPARIGGVGMVDDAVLERECAHAGRLPRERRRIRADTCRDLGERALRCRLGRR